MTAPETVEVPVALLEALRDWCAAGGYCSGSGDSVLVTKATMALEHLLALLPYEPSDFEVGAYCNALGWEAGHEREAVKDYLRRLHAAGFRWQP